jgi:molybdopterin-guanine dinucleotide biosynthesis protein B
LTPQSAHFEGVELKIIGFAAYSGNGKTTLIEHLIPLLGGRGLRVSVIKHAHHGIDADESGKDSGRHRAAGALEVLVASGPGADLRASITQLADCDVVLVEGFRHAPIPKIEVHFVAAGTPWLFPGDPHIVALATDAYVATELPVFGLNEYAAIADFLVGHLGLEGCISPAKRG